MNKKSKNELAQKILKDRGLSPAEEGEAAARQDAYDLEDALVPRYAVQVLSTPLLVKFARGHYDMKRLAHAELANRGLNADGKWVGAEASESLLKEAESRCPSCSGPGSKISGPSVWVTYKCRKCQGIFSPRISLTEIEKYVIMNEWVDDAQMVEAAANRGRYFDFRFLDVNGNQCRIHGYFDCESKKLIQLG